MDATKTASGNLTRLSVLMSEDTASALQEVMARHGLRATDVVNEAIRNLNQLDRALTIRRVNVFIKTRGARGWYIKWKWPL